MPARIRFHLDEHIDPAIADGLRRRGIDVSTTAESRLLSADDSEHIALARSQGRVIVTCDADFLRLHRQGVPHAGIVYCPRGRQAIGELLRYLVLLWECLTDEEVRDHVEFF